MSRVNIRSSAIHCKCSGGKLTYIFLCSDLTFDHQRNLSIASLLSLRQSASINREPSCSYRHNIQDGSGELSSVLWTLFEDRSATDLMLMGRTVTSQDPDFEEPYY